MSTDEAGAVPDEAILDYVKSSAMMMGIAMDPARAARVAGHLQRTAAMACLLEEAALDVSEEPAEIYRLERASGAAPTAYLTGAGR